MCIVLISVSGLNVSAQKERSQVQDNYKWDLKPIYGSDAEWESSKDKLVAGLSGIENFKGTLTRSAADLYRCLDYLSGIEKEASRLYGYSSMNSDLDTRDMKYSSMTKELQQLFSDFSAKASFVNPEILSMDWQKIEQFIKDEPKLEIYRKGLKDLFHEKEHTLSQGEERIMALSGLISGVPSSTFNTFSNAEMPSPEVTLSTGEKISFLQVPDIIFTEGFQTGPTASLFSGHSGVTTKNLRLLMVKCFTEAL